MSESLVPLPSEDFVDWVGKKDDKEYAVQDLSWRQVRPTGEWVIIKADPRVKKTAGGIILTEALTKIERVMEGSGRIVKVGPEAKDVVVGDRVAFRGFLKDVSRGMLVREDDCDVFFLKEADILMILDEGVEVGEFAGGTQE